MEIDDLQCGVAGEHIVCADLIIKGFIVHPTTQGIPYDVILDANGKMFKVQVKTTRSPGEVQQRVYRKRAYIFNVLRNGKNAHRIGYDEKHVDLFALVALDTRQIAYLARSEAKKFMQFRSDTETYQGEGKKELIAKCQKMRDAGKTLQNIGAAVGKHYTYIGRLLNGEEDKDKFGRYFNEFTIERALSKLA